mmetsp:Transcript_60705/g.140186  ORF Transcript_60705/g.140186 Transcript_60705/m.140186 type:complete len:657 (-) Transcript_60705:53-2023(-)
MVWQRSGATRPPLGDGAGEPPAAALCALARWLGVPAGLGPGISEPGPDHAPAVPGAHVCCRRGASAVGLGSGSASGAGVSTPWPVTPDTVGLLLGNRGNSTWILVAWRHRWLAQRNMANANNPVVLKPAMINTFAPIPPGCPPANSVPLSFTSTGTTTRPSSPTTTPDHPTTATPTCDHTSPASFSPSSSRTTRSSTSSESVRVSNVASSSEESPVSSSKTTTSMPSLKRRPRRCVGENPGPRSAIPAARTGLDTRSDTNSSASGGPVGATACTCSAAACSRRRARKPCTDNRPKGTPIDADSALRTLLLKSACNSVLAKINTGGGAPLSKCNAIRASRRTVVVVVVVVSVTPLNSCCSLATTTIPSATATASNPPSISKGSPNPVRVATRTGTLFNGPTKTSKPNRPPAQSSPSEKANFAATWAISKFTASSTTVTHVFATAGTTSTAPSIVNVTSFGLPPRNKADSRIAATFHSTPGAAMTTTISTEAPPGHCRGAAQKSTTGGASTPAWAASWATAVSRSTDALPEARPSASSRAGAVARTSNPPEVSSASHPGPSHPGVQLHSPSSHEPPFPQIHPPQVGGGVPVSGSVEHAGPVHPTRQAHDPRKQAPCKHDGLHSGSLSSTALHDWQHLFPNLPPKSEWKKSHTSSTPAW